jgi:dTDP-4-dehydrorhamnose 3,5-epimerase
MKRLSIDGALLYTPRIHHDDRGDFLESFRAADLREATGHAMELAQINCSVSRRGVLRGVHFADVPPGQAKYVMCVAGEVLDVVVDVRKGSPTFGLWVGVRLDEESRRGIYLAEGLGHAFLTLSDSATVVYVCSTGYDPVHEHGIHPLDPDLAIEWPLMREPVLSPKDAAAPTLKQALDLGILPSC